MQRRGRSRLAEPAAGPERSADSPVRIPERYMRTRMLSCIALLLALIVVCDHTILSRKDHGSRFIMGLLTGSGVIAFEAVARLNAGESRRTAVRYDSDFGRHYKIDRS